MPSYRPVIHQSPNHYHQHDEWDHRRTEDHYDKMSCQYGYYYQDPRHDYRPHASRIQPLHGNVMARHWPPSPSVEDETDSLSREHIPTLPNLVGNEAKMRGSIDQQPILVEVEDRERKEGKREFESRDSDRWSLRSGSSDDSNGPATPTGSVCSNTERRFVYQPHHSPETESDGDRRTRQFKAGKVGMENITKPQRRQSRKAAPKLDPMSVIEKERKDADMVRQAREPSPYAFSAGSRKSTLSRDHLVLSGTANSGERLSASYGDTRGRRREFPLSGRGLSNPRVPATASTVANTPNPSTRHIPTNNQGMLRSASFGQHATHTSTLVVPQPRRTSSFPIPPREEEKYRSNSSSESEVSSEETDKKLNRRRRSRRSSRISNTDRESITPRPDGFNRFSNPGLNTNLGPSASQTPLSGSYGEKALRDPYIQSSRASAKQRSPLASPLASPLHSPHDSPPSSPRDERRNRDSNPAGGLQASSRPSSPKPGMSPRGIEHLDESYFRDARPHPNRSYSSSVPSSPSRQSSVHSDYSRSPNFDPNPSHEYSRSRRGPALPPRNTDVPALPPRNAGVPALHSRNTDIPNKAGLKIAIQSPSPTLIRTKTTPKPTLPPRPLSGELPSQFYVHLPRPRSSGQASTRHASFEVSGRSPASVGFPERSFGDFVQSPGTNVKIQKPAVTAAPTLPPCSRPSPVIGYKDWSTLPGIPGFDVCPPCREGLQDAGFRGRFVSSRPKPAETAVRCHLSVPWVRMAWLLILQGRAPDVDIVRRTINVLLSEPPCPGQMTELRAWFRIYNAESGGHVYNFDVCPCCVRLVETLFPNLTGAFLGGSHFVAQRSCRLAADGARFARYVDLLEDISTRANDRRREPDMLPFARLAHRLASAKQCSRDNQFRGAPWHYIPYLPDFTVCEECYLDVVWPAAAAGSDVAAMFCASPQLVPHADAKLSCQLYSPRMRGVFEASCRRNDFPGLRSAALQRVGKERELQGKLERLKRADGVSVEREVGELVEEWKRYE